jgi:hypothetical protein
MNSYSQTGLVGEESFINSTNDVGFLIDSVDYDTLRFRLDKFQKYHVLLALDTINAGFPNGTPHKVALKYRTVTRFYNQRREQFFPTYDDEGTEQVFTTIEDSVRKVGLFTWNNYRNVYTVQDSCLDHLEIIISREDSLKGGMGATSRIKYILRVMGTNKSVDLTQYATLDTLGDYILTATAVDSFGTFLKRNAVADSISAIVNSTVGSDSLVACYTFDGNVFDYSPFGNNGTNNSGTFRSQIDSFRVGTQALSFNGVNDTVDISAIVNDLSNTIVGTIMFWVKPTVLAATTNTMVGFGDTDANEFFFIKNNDATGVIDAFFRVAGTTQWRTNTTNSVLSVGVWTHYAIVQDGTQVKMYVNGSIASTIFTDDTDKTAWFRELTGIDNALLGATKRNNLGAIDFYNGLMDEYKQFKKDLSPAEIYSHYINSVIYNLQQTKLDKFGMPVTPVGEFYIADTDTVATTIATQDLYVPMAGTTSSESNKQQYFTHTNNALIFDGIAGVDSVLLTATLNVSLVSNVTGIAGIKIAFNEDSLSYNKTEQHRKISPGTPDVGAMSTSGTFWFTAGDSLRVFVGIENNTGIITVEHAVLTVKK